MIASKTQKQPRLNKVSASKVSPANAIVDPNECCAFTQIAERAFEIYESHGGTHGHDIQDWLLAERLVMAH